MNKSNELVWITVEGIEKRDILKGMGFKIDSEGILIHKGRKVKTVDDSGYVKADEVKAIIPGSVVGSLKVITDISELEMISGSE